MKKFSKDNIFKSATTVFAESAFKSLIISSIYGLIKAQYKNDYSELAESLYTSFPVFAARGMSREIIDYEEVDSIFGKYSKLLPYVTGFCSKASMNHAIGKDKNTILKEGFNTSLYEIANDIGHNNFFGSIFDSTVIEKVTEVFGNILNHKNFHDNISNTESLCDVILINMIVKCFYEPAISIVKDQIDHYYGDNDSLSLTGEDTGYISL